MLERGAGVCQQFGELVRTAGRRRVLRRRGGPLGCPKPPLYDRRSWGPALYHLAIMDILYSTKEFCDGAGVRLLHLAP